MIDRFTGEYSWLSNFSQHAGSPGKAKRLGAKLTFDNGKLRQDWYDVNMVIMYNGLRAKFMQHEHLKQRLLDTGVEDIAEGNNWGDTYWGTVDGVGENHLGKLLMLIRRELKGD